MSRPSHPPPTIHAPCRPPYGDDRGMQTPRWSEVACFFGRTDAQPLGVYVFGAGVEDWEKAIAAVVSQGWQVGFTSIGRPDLPGVREIFAGADDLSASLSVQP